MDAAEKKVRKRRKPLATLDMQIEAYRIRAHMDPDNPDFSFWAQIQHGRKQVLRANVWVHDSVKGTLGMNPDVWVTMLQHAKRALEEMAYKQYAREAERAAAKQSTTGTPWPNSTISSWATPPTLPYQWALTKAKESPNETTKEPPGETKRRPVL